MFIRIFFSLALLLPRITLAAGILQKNVDAVAGATGAGLGKPRLPVLVGGLINGALSLLGVVLLALLVYGGYTWMTAQGEEEAITKAKSIIRQAIIGLIIIMAAGAITFFVTSRLESITSA